MRVKPPAEMLAPRFFGHADDAYSKRVVLGITCDIADCAGAESYQPLPPGSSSYMKSMAGVRVSTVPSRFIFKYPVRPWGMARSLTHDKYRIRRRLYEYEIGGWLDKDHVRHER